MKLILFNLFLFFSLSSQVFGLVRLDDDEVRVGSEPSNYVLLSASSSYLSVDKTLSALGFDDGTINLANGRLTDKASGAYHRFDASSQKWVYSNDGTTEKKVGSGSGSGASGINLLSNNSFEDGITQSWTCSGGSPLEGSHSNSREGNEKFLNFTATTSGEYCETNMVTVSDDIGAGCMADIKYKQGENSFEYQILNGSSEVVSSGKFSDLDSFLKSPTVTFPCGPSDQFKFRVVSTQAGIIDLDDAYLGSNKGFVSGSYLNTCHLTGADGRDIYANTEPIPFFGTCSGWVSGVNDSDHATGNYYSVQRAGSIVEFSGYVDAASGGYGGYLDLYKNGIFYKRIAENASDRYRRLHYKSKAGEFAKNDKLSFAVTATITLSNGVNTAHYLSVEEKSGETQEAFTPEQANFFISANIGGGNASLFTASTPTLVKHTNLDLVLNQGAAKIACDGIASTGSTCSGASEAVGINFSVPVSGTYKVCTTFGKSDQGTVVFRLAETGLADNTILQQGNQAMINVATSGSNRLCSEFKFSSVGEKVVKLFYEGTSGGVDTVLMDRSAAEFDRDLNMTVELVSHNVSRPVINNMVSTSVKDGVRVDGCYVSGSAGNISICDDFIKSITLSGTSNVIVFENAYPDIPSCTASSISGSGNQITHQITALSTTGLTLQGKSNTTNTYVDYTLICIGEQ